MKKYYINVEGTFNLTDCKANALNRPKYFKKDAQGNWILTLNASEAESGTQIMGGAITGYTYSSNAAVYNLKGTFNFYAGHIAGNANRGVYNGSSFNMYGGVISYNRAGNGGGVSFGGAESVFNMYGGLIAYNEAAGTGYGNGGGVYGQEGTFNMYDGAVIRSNTAANYGGGVALPNNDAQSVTFNMYGGTIGGDVMGGVSQGNKAASGGGGVYFKDTFNMTGGTITGNTAEYGGGVYAEFYKSCSIADAAITNNNGGGVYLLQSGTKGFFRLGGKVTFSGNTHGNDKIPADLYIANLDNETSSGVYFNYANTLAPTSPIQVYFHSPDTAATVYFTNGWSASIDQEADHNAYFVCSNPKTSAGEYVLVEEDRGGLQELQLVKGYTVTFDTNDKGEGVPVQTFLADAANTNTVQKPADPTAAGWKFEGWYTDANCTTAYDFTAAVSSSFTLYAKWSETVTASLNTTEFVYDGYKHWPIVSVKRGDTLLENSTYTVTYPDESTEVGTYTVTVEMLNSSDGPFTLDYKIVTSATVEPVVTLSETEFTYNSSVQKPTVTVKYGNTTLAEGTDYTVDWGEDLSQDFINAGGKLVTIRMQGAYTGQIDKTFTINPKPVAIPAEPSVSEFTYDGQAKTYDLPTNDGYTIIGNVQTEAGTYTVTVKLNANYIWNDDTTADKTYTFTINGPQVSTAAKPAADTTEFVYDGAEKMYGIVDTDAYTVTGNKQTFAGTYKVTVTLNANYEWEDGTTDDLTYDFIIHKAKVDIPEEDTTVFTYDGEEKTYTIAADSRYTVSGNVQTEAGTYTVTVSLNDTDNYQWNDDTTADKTYDFVINAQQSGGEDPGENPGEGGGQQPGEGGGKFDHVTVPSDNALSGDIDMSLGDIVDAVLTEKEQNGSKPIDIELKVKDASETMPASEKKSIDQGAAGDEIVMYLDITLSKKIGNGKEQAISETNAPIRISLQVPAWAINHDPAVNRIYYMLHLHDGVVEHIHGNFDPLTNTFSFETDCFSPYALAYTDVTALGVPKTGSTFPVWATALCLMGLAGMIVCFVSARRKHNR